MFGKWDESLNYSNVSMDLGQDVAYLLWKQSKQANIQTKYNFTRFAITLNELSPDLEVPIIDSPLCNRYFWFMQNLFTLFFRGLCKQEKLPPTDSRLRPDQRFLENGEYEVANSEKLRLEQRQRQVTLASFMNNLIRCIIHILEKYSSFFALFADE